MPNDETHGTRPAPPSPKRCEPYICGIDAAIDVVTGKWKSLIL